MKGFRVYRLGVRVYLRGATVSSELSVCSPNIAWAVAGVRLSKR
jgi:hypothetical protein